MFDIAEELSRWVDEGREFAVATVVAVSGSAPRLPGAALAVDSEGAAIGSVSGGCVEGAVYELCREALASGEAVVERFGYSDDDAFAVGLTCGGVIDVLVAPGRGVALEAVRGAAAGESLALARVVSGPSGMVGRGVVVRGDGSYEGSLEGGLGGDAGGRYAGLDRAAVAEVRALLDAGRTGTVEVARCAVPVKLLVESSVPAPRMIVFGAIDFASALVRIGKFLGYHVTVCDARPVFTTRERFPEADEVVVEWPHQYLERTETDARTVLCVLTHDAKFDIPLLRLALRLPVAYIGAMGSRRTHLDRLTRLRESGVTELELTRLRSPIGLDLGARTPEETALSIAAEITANRRGGTGLPLTGAHTPIHHEEPPPPARLGAVA
ncbi:XdhC/CoxI family protein [Streptomyces sp. NPDC004539]|uniref:XdhC family protein n=1 Tax=Streptomyces sp. NPDC004539 TaxID=3154280 RepID=UPI0033B1DE47